MYLEYICNKKWSSHTQVPNKQIIILNSFQIEQLEDLDEMKTNSLPTLLNLVEGYR